MKTNVLRKAIAKMVILVLLVAGTLVTMTVLADRASATTECVPAEAWQEDTDWTTESPGDDWTVTDTRWVENWVEVANPDYVPAWTETIEHDAVYEWVWHDAEYEWVHHPAEYVTLYKWVKNGGKGEQWLPEGESPTDGRWTKTSKTKQHLVKEAWEEKVLVKDAWEEQVEVEEAWTEIIEHEAQGEEFLLEDQGWEEMVYTRWHDEVVCEEEPPVTEEPTTQTPTEEPTTPSETPSTPPVTPVEEPTVVEEPTTVEEPQIEETPAVTLVTTERIVTADDVVLETLPETGVGRNGWLIGIAVLLAAAGTGLWLVRRRSDGW